MGVVGYRVLRRAGGEVEIRFYGRGVAVRRTSGTSTCLGSVGKVRSIAICREASSLVVCCSFSEDRLVRVLTRFDFRGSRIGGVRVINATELIRHRCRRGLVVAVILHCFEGVFCPLPLEVTLTCVGSVGCVLGTLGSLTGKRLGISILSTITVAISLVENSFRATSDIVFLLGVNRVLRR